MFVRLNRDLALSLEEPQDFRRFKLVVEGGRDGLERAQVALGEAARLSDAETAWVSETWLRRRPALADDAVWQEGLSKMIDAARKHGWIDDATRSIKAHVEWSP